MHRSFWLNYILAFVLVTFGGVGIAQASNKDSAENKIQVSKFLAAVQKALLRAQGDLWLEGGGTPPLKSVTLTLKAEAQKGAGGHLNLYIVSIGGETKQSESHEVVITLTPPDPKSPKDVAADPSAVTSKLVELITSTALEVRDAHKNEDYPLDFTGLKVVLGFVVEKKAEGGAQFEIVPIGGDLKGTWSSSDVQKIAIEFKNPEPQK